MASLVLLTLVVTSLLSVSANGQTAQYFTDSTPLDYYHRVSLNDCPLRFYPNSKPNPNDDEIPTFAAERAWLGEFQHMAAIGWTTNMTTEYLCVGTLISSKFVLTAAHCAMSRFNTAPNTVRLGDTISDEEEDDQAAQQINIRTFKKHPQYRPSRKYYDIALIELESEARFDDATCSACLWLEKEVPPEEMVSIGFGATGYGKSLSPTLQKVKLLAIDKESCVERLPISTRALPDGFVDEQFCAGSDRMDTCEVYSILQRGIRKKEYRLNFQPQTTGDSGGPIQIERADVDGKKIPLVVGIVSFGTPCTNGSLGVYTRVASYREWIEQEIQRPVDYLTCTRTSSCTKYLQIGIEPNNRTATVRIGLLWNFSERNHFQCGATLIDYRFALTSAYCAQEKQSQPKYIVVDSTGETVKINRVIIHPQYNPGRRANDIALLKLSKYLKLNANIQPACLFMGNEESSRSYDDIYYSAYSTRYARNNNFRKDDYQQYTIQPEEHINWDCTSLEHRLDNLTCRYNNINLIPTVCNIDHGGPVYIRSFEGIQYLHGLVSDLSEGCSGNLIAIKVTPHVEWIERTVLDHTYERLIFQ